MVWESVLFMFWCALGTFQMIAAWASLRGLSFFNQKIAGYIFGCANIVAAFCWFFTTIEIGENGAKGQHYEQIVSVVLGVASAALITAIISSIIRFKSFDKQISCEKQGLEVFKEMTLYRLIQCYFDRERGIR